MENATIVKLLKETPIINRLQVINEMTLFAFLEDLGVNISVEYLYDYTLGLSKLQINEFNEWEKDGKPV